MCSEKLETTERMIARSSTRRARWGKRSLTGIPLSPYWRNFHGLLQHVAHVVELGGVRLHLDGLAVLAIEPRLGVERVDLGGAAVHVEEDDAPAAGWMMTGPSRQRTGTRRRLGRRIADPRAEGRLAEQRCAGQRTEAVGAAQQHVAAADGCGSKVAAVHGDALPIGPARPGPALNRCR